MVRNRAFRTEPERRSAQVNRSPVISEPLRSKSTVTIMEWLNGQTSPIGTGIQSVRERVRKTMSTSKSSVSKRGSQCSTATMLSEPSRRGTSSKSTIPLSADLTNSRWIDYIEWSGLGGAPRYSSSSDKRPVFAAPHPHLGPELAHLQINDMVARPSLENLLSKSAPTPNPRRLTLKRNGKPTSFFKLGSRGKALELEIKPVKKRASIELIADQYNAVLEHRDRMNAELAATLELSMESPAMEAQAEPILLNRVFDPTRLERSTVEDRYRRTTFEMPPQDDLPELSPASDGTLVSFEEDAIYFKPISFSRASSPTLGQQTTDRCRSSFHSDQSSQHMQTCIDLLTGQMSSVLDQQPSTSSTVASASQLWAMIEMYENLRDQLYDMNLGELERRNVTLMFDCWLSSLHSIHDSLTPNIPRARGQHTEDYDNIELD